MPPAAPQLPMHVGSFALCTTGGGPPAGPAPGTGGVTLAGTVHPRHSGEVVGGAPGRAKHCLAQGAAQAGCPGGGATVHVNRWALRVHHLSDCS